MATSAVKRKLGGEKENEIEEPITTRNEKVFPKKVTFQSLKVSEWLLKQLTTMGMKDPTEIQQRAIPAIKSGIAAPFLISFIYLLLLF